MTRDDRGTQGEAIPLQATLDQSCGASKSVDQFDDASEIGTYPVNLTLYDVRAQGDVWVFLKRDQPAWWADACTGSRFVGVSIGTAPRGAVLALSRFVLNSEQLLLSTYQACSEIRIRLYASTPTSYLSGYTDLPPGASMILESSVERTAMMECGRASFHLMLR